MADTNITAKLLRDLCLFDPQTGAFVWKRRPIGMFKDLRSCEAWNGRYAGALAGSIGVNGYLSLRINNRAYWAHRLAWLHVTGVWPRGEIDHINGNPSDNRISNLRDVCAQINCQNIRVRPAKSSPLPIGAHFVPRKKERRYASKLRINGKSVHLGYFDSADDAHNAYVAAKRKHHEGCTI